MNSRKTSKSLVLSVVSLLVCMFLLIGSTFAWFSTSATSNTNVIMTGAFNISVDFCNNFSGAEDDWTSLDSNTLFDNVVLNPGDNTGVMYIRITNSNNYPVSVNASLIEKTVTDNNTELRFYSKKVTEATSADDLLAETPVSLVSAAKFVEDEEIDPDSELYVAILVDCVGEDSTPSTQDITAQFKIFLSAAQLAAGPLPEYVTLTDAGNCIDAAFIMGNNGGTLITDYNNIEAGTHINIFILTDKKAVAKMGGNTYSIVINSSGNAVIDIPYVTGDIVIQKLN